MQKQGKISFGAAVLMSINIIVGVGVLISPQGVTAAAGGMSFLGWLLVGLVMFPIVWSVAQASSIFPGSGGFYNYCSKGINKTAGFFAQWVYLLGYLGVAASVTAFLRGIIAQTCLPAAAEYPLIFNAIVIAFFSCLNLIDINRVSKIQSIATVLKMLPIFFVIAVLPFYWNTSITYSAADLMNLGLTIPLISFAFWGFEACCSLGDFLEGGTQQVGKVILTAFFITVALYMLFHLGLIHIMGVSDLAAYGPVVFPQFMGLSPVITSIIATGITSTIVLMCCNSIFGISLGNITNLFVLAREKLIGGGSFLTKMNSNHRPVIAALVHGIALWLLLAFISSAKILAAFTNLGVLVAFILTLVAVFLFQKRQGNYFQVILTLFGFGSCVVLTYYSWIGMGVDQFERLVNLSPLLGGAILGLVLYKVQQAKNKIAGN